MFYNNYYDHVTIMNNEKFPHQNFEISGRETKQLVGVA